MTSTDYLKLRFGLSQLLLLNALIGLGVEGLMGSIAGWLLLVFVSISIIQPRITGFIPRRWTIHATFLLLAIIVSDFILNWGTVFDPLMRMSFIVLGYRTFFYRTTREASQVLLLSLFVIIFTGVISISIGYVVQLLSFLPLGASLLVLTTLKQDSWDDIPNHETWGSSLFIISWLAAAARIPTRVWSWMSLFYIGAILVTTAIFVILPRFQFQSVFPSFQIAGVARAGFSETIELGSVSEIILDSGIAFTVIPESDKAIEQSYWKMVVLDAYKDGNFYHSDRYLRNLRPPWVTSSYYYLPPKMFPRNRLNSVETINIYLEGNVSRYIPHQSSFRAIEFSHLNIFRVDPILATFRLREAPSKVTQIKLFGTDPNSVMGNPVMDRYLFDQNLLSNQPDTYPLTTLNLALKNEDKTYLLNIAREIHPDLGGIDVERAGNLITEYLHRNHRYDLGVDPTRKLSDDPIINWLMEEGDGHCEMFAGAFCLIARASGIPARLVTGFSGGEWNDQGNYLVVRNREAHAWVEVFKQDAGWIRMDPTPPDYQGVIARYLAQQQANQVANWGEWLEHLKLLYYQKIVSFEGDDQEAIKNLFSRFTWLSDRSRDDQGTARQKETNFSLPVRPFALGFLFLTLAVSVYVSFINRKSVFSMLSSDHRNTRLRKKARFWLRKWGTGFNAEDPVKESLYSFAYGPSEAWNLDDKNHLKHIRKHYKALLKRSKNNKKI